MPGMIYFVQGPDAGLIKIGHTDQEPDRRIFGLQSMSPVPITKLGVMPGDRWDEKAVHRMFLHLRRYNEWFEPGADLLAFIAEHARPWPSSGLVAPSSLPEHWIACRNGHVATGERFADGQAFATRYNPDGLRIHLIHEADAEPFVMPVRTLASAKAALAAAVEFKAFLWEGDFCADVRFNGRLQESIDGRWIDWQSADGYTIDCLPDDVIEAIDAAVYSELAPAPRL